MADYIDREELYEKIKNTYIASLQLCDGSSNAYAYCANAITDMPSVDAVEVVRCKDCVYWQDEKIQTENGEYRDYLPDEKPFVTIDKGINVGAHCTLHGFEDMSGSWFWAQENDFCSKGVKKNEIN